MVSTIGGTRDVVRFWGVLILLYTVVTLTLVIVGAPSPHLFGGAVAGALGALFVRGARPLPDRVRDLGLVVIGVGAGSMIDKSVVTAVLAQPIAVLGGVIATLAVSMAAGQLLRFSPHVSGRTAIFASIAGGASGVTAVAKELGADESIVLAVQYLRVLVVLATVPIVAGVLGATTSETSATGASAGWSWSNLGFTTASLAVGVFLAHLLPFSASRLVLPMLVSAGLSVSGVFATAALPVQVLNFGYAATGLMVGLSLTPATLRRLGRIMPLALLQVVVGVVGCAAIGLALAKAIGLSPLDGYLATTPGGLPAVTAVAIGSGASVGLILTVQLVRLFLALLIAPLVGGYLRRHGSESAN